MIRDTRIKFKRPVDGMRKTIALIGSAIQKSTTYLPIRNHAAAVATKARAKDYYGQVQELYKDFLKRWKYVRDPLGTETVASSPQAIYKLVLGFNGGVGDGLGAGDCDDATAAMGSLLCSIGFPVRIATTAPQGHGGRMFTHVFIQTRIPGRPGWLTVDPVGYPKHDLGWIQPHSRIAYWDLNGRLIGGKNIDQKFLRGGRLGDDLEGKKIMAEQWQDVGFAGAESIESSDPESWDKTILKNFGCHIDKMGYIADGNKFAIEVDDTDAVDENGNVRTPMLELSADDYNYLNTVHFPYDGMTGIGDEGDLYQYDGNLGFFKKLRRRLKRRVRRIRKRVRKALRRTRIGKWVVKIGDKLRKVALKIVKPLLKVVGKWAGKLAPIAALIPGFGPAIAGAMVATGKVAKLMNKYGLKLIQPLVKGKRSKIRRIQTKNPRALKAFKRELEREARKLKGKRSRSQIAIMARRLKNTRQRGLLGELDDPRHLIAGSDPFKRMLSKMNIRYVKQPRIHAAAGRRL